MIDCNKFILLILKLTDNGQLMLDNLKELRKKGKGDSPKGRKLTNDIEKLLNNVKNAVSQSRGLKGPNQPDSASLEQGIVKMD